MIILREYQKKALNNLYKSLKSNNKVLLSLPTGAGKTIMMATWALKMAQSNKRTAIIVDRIELVQQTLIVLNGDATVLKSGYTFDPNRLIHIIMLQTANRRTKQLLDVKYDYVFFDEVHQYCEGKTFTALCDCQQSAKIIGVSATPIDSKGYLLAGFDDCINDIQTQDLIDLQYLVKPVYYSWQSYNLDLSFIRLVNGDYDNSELDNLLANVQNAQRVFNEWSKIASNLKTLTFCSSIKQAKILLTYFKDKGVKCALVYGDMPISERLTVLNEFKKGSIKVLFNVGCLVAGYDEPTIQCILFANPTKVLRRYLQQAGRGLRASQNKEQCVMIDCANLVREHGFCNDLRFYRGRQKQADKCTIKQCPECGAIIDKSIKVCPYCNYDFSTNFEKVGPTRKLEIERLQKAFDMQQQLKQTIAKLVDDRGFKNGYKWYLFLDCLKTKKPTESSLQFFRRKMTKIKKIQKNNWNLAALRYN